jgi:hypothetical protein
MMLTCLKKVIQSFVSFVVDPFRTERNGALGGNGQQLSIVRKNVKKRLINVIEAIIQKTARCLH